MKAESRKQKAEMGVRTGAARSAFSFLLSAFCFLLCTCASAPVPTHAARPEWQAVPTGVVESLCRRLHDDAIATGGTLAIVRTTRPLATTTSMSALANASFKRANAARVVDAMTESHGSMPIAVAGGSCTWEAIGDIDPAHADVMVVELSSPVANPYARNEAGLFARVSLGGEDAAWYWIPLVQRGGAWAVGHIIPLGGMR